MSSETLMTPPLLRAADFEYDVPPEQIAQTPVTPRDHSKLMVLDRRSPSISHLSFHQIGTQLRSGDVLVLNVTRVFPARLRGKKPSGGKAELLLLRMMDSSETRWKALVRGVTAAGAEIVFSEGLTACLEERLENGEWVVRFSQGNVRAYLERLGEMPLPPYIKRLTKNAVDQSTYQTVFAQTEGSIAAPTAGFHFTPELLTQLKTQGVEIVEVLLHVGWGTFRPVRAENLAEHQMLPESYEVTETAAARLNKAKAEGRRVIAVGTTTVRTLESICEGGADPFRAGAGATNLFIYPGYQFKAIDALITNFHLSDSTPLLLACAFYSSVNGRSDNPFSLRAAYQAAIESGYRFYSYGDAMFIQ